jgi:origin recognition complex subunit 2
MIVSSKQQLKENLKELMDHKILIEKAGKYTMQYSNTILTQLSAKMS